MIPFNRPHVTGKEFEYLRQVLAGESLCGNGPFTQRCQQWIERDIGCTKALLTHSCTAALEMSAILAGVRAGDEVIMPSYTFVSTANAFVLRGATPVFVDIRPDTLNIDEKLIESAITEKTKAIVAVHYAGIGCEMDVILDIASRHGILVIEDAAQGVLANYGEKRLGSLGHLGALSFHETKNIISGEGGALLVNDEAFVERAEIVWEKGTNRRQFFKGKVDKYTWVDVGSSFLPGEIVAGFLWAQLQEAERLTRARMNAWNAYDALLRPKAASLGIRLPSVPVGCKHNAHMYYVLLPTASARARVLKRLDERGVKAVFHYVPLHNAPAGKKFARTHGALMVTEELSARLVRLPLWVGIEKWIPTVVEALEDSLS